MRWKNNEKTPLAFWMMTVFSLVLAFKGVYIQGRRRSKVTSRAMRLLLEVIELLKLCLVIKTLVGDLL